MIFLNKKNLVLLISTLTFQPLAHATFCSNLNNSSTAPTSFHSTQYSFQTLNVLCTSLITLMPQLKTQPTFKKDSQEKLSVWTGHARSKEPLAKRTGKRAKEKEMTLEFYILSQKAGTEKRSILGLLSSEELQDQKMGQVAFYQLMMEQLIWKTTHSRRHFFMSKMKQFFKDINGKSEEEIIQFYDWFLVEVNTGKRHSKNGPKLKKKDRPWRRELSDREVATNDFREESDPSEQLERVTFTKSGITFEYQDDAKIEQSEENHPSIPDENFETYSNLKDSSESEESLGLDLLEEVSIKSRKDLYQPQPEDSSSFRQKNLTKIEDSQEELESSSESDPSNLATLSDLEDTADDYIVSKNSKK